MNVRNVRKAAWFMSVAVIGALGVSQASANMLLNPGFESPEVPDGMFVVPGADNWTTFNTA